jgi:outer membrane protein assembly factor BamB
MRMMRTMRVLLLLAAATLLLGGCDWTTFRSGPARMGFNPGESKINAGNVGQLTQQWVTAGSSSASPPVVSGALLYSGGIAAFSADGSQNCSGAPKVCQPIWRSNVFADEAPTVAGGVAYVAANDNHVYAYDAAGTTNCTAGPNPGDPRTCAPLWSAAVGGARGATVVDATLYVRGRDFFGFGYVYAFDATGQRRCTGNPKVCAPLWRDVLGKDAFGEPPAVAHGLVYVPLSNEGKVRVFDAAGQNGCGGSPVVCQPLWIADTGTHANLTTPVVSDDGMFVVGLAAGVFTFDSGGVYGCSGSPRTCTPLWRAPASVTAPAVAYHTLYLASGNRLVAYDARGTANCGGTPRTCAPLWTGPSVGSNDSPAVANGLVYTAANEDGSCVVLPPGTICTLTRRLQAFDAAGSTNCDAAHICSPLWQDEEQKSYDPDFGQIPGFGEPVIANGYLYAVANPADPQSAPAQVYAFTVP